MGAIGTTILMYLGRRRRHQRAPSGEYGGLIDKTPQSPKAMFQANTHSIYSLQASSMHYVSAILFYEVSLTPDIRTLGILLSSNSLVPWLIQSVVDRHLIQSVL